MSEAAAIPQEADAVTPVEPKKKSKIDEKREQIFRERMQRHIAKGKTPEQAYAAIQKEDYDRMSVADKLELQRKSFASSLEGVASDLSMLHGNQKDLADVMDLNFKAFGKMLAKLGLSEKDQDEILSATFEEIKAERQAAIAAAAAEAEKQKKADLAESVDKAGTPTVPEGAQVFGG